MKKLSYLTRLGFHGGKFLWAVFVILCSAAAMLLKKNAWAIAAGGVAAVANTDSASDEDLARNYGFASELWTGHPSPDAWADGSGMCWADGSPMAYNSSHSQWPLYYGDDEDAHGHW